MCATVLQARADIPPNIGPALIVSHTERCTAAEVVAESGLEPLDDYEARSVVANEKNRAGQGPGSSGNGG